MLQCIGNYRIFLVGKGYIDVFFKKIKSETTRNTEQDLSFRETSQNTTIILQVRDGNGLDRGSAEKTEADLGQIFEEGLKQCRDLFVTTSAGRVKKGVL